MLGSLCIFNKIITGYLSLSHCEAKRLLVSYHKSDLKNWKADKIFSYNLNQKIYIYISVEKEVPESFCTSLEMLQQSPIWPFVQSCHLLIIPAAWTKVASAGCCFYLLYKAVYVKSAGREKVIPAGIPVWIHRHKLLRRGHGPLLFMVMFYICVCRGWITWQKHHLILALVHPK